jgi:heptosyltransferase III
VRRYQGEPLPERATIAVVANDALGNYVACTPLLQMLRTAYPAAKIHLFSGMRVAEFLAHEPTADLAHPLFGKPPHESLRVARMDTEGEEGRGDGYDLVVNIEQSSWAKCFAAAIAGDFTYVCGPSLAPDGRGDWAHPGDDRGALWADQRWIAEDLTSRYPFLNSGFIAEIFCRLAYLEGPVPGYRIPQQDPGTDVPEILIATTASLPEKLWPREKWLAALEALRGRSVGLLGAKPSVQGQFWKGASDEDLLVESGLVQDLRGRFTLPQVVGALAKAKRVLTLDNGILHMAVAAGTPTVGLYRHGIHRLWAPPSDNLTVITPGEGRTVADISVEEVVHAL